MEFSFCFSQEKSSCVFYYPNSPIFYADLKVSISKIQCMDIVSDEMYVQSTKDVFRKNFQRKVVQPT